MCALKTTKSKVYTNPIVVENWLWPLRCPQRNFRVFSTDGTSENKGQTRIEQASPSLYVGSPNQTLQERNDVKKFEHEFASKQLGADEIIDAAGLKKRDLNYVTRSKSEKKEQKASWAVQRSKTIYLNMSKGKNDGALAKLIEDSTERRFRINVLFRGFWKKKKTVKFK